MKIFGNGFVALKRRSLFTGDVHLHITPRRPPGDHGHDLADMRLDERPVIRTEDQNGDIPTGLILLISQFPIGGDEEIKIGRFRLVELRRHSEGQPNRETKRL